MHNSDCRIAITDTKLNVIMNMAESFGRRWCQANKKKKMTSEEWSNYFQRVFFQESLLKLMVFHTCANHELDHLPVKKVPTMEDQRDFYDFIMQPRFYSILNIEGFMPYKQEIKLCFRSDV